jgi:glycerophosphoryl diester phosphodiesterase
LATPLSRVSVTAHRGASGRYPENTRAAFLAAIELGVDIIEFDVRLTRDQQLVVLHDAGVERFAPGGGEAAELDLAQLLEIDAGTWFHEEFAGQRLLSLQQTLELMPPSMRLNVHVKATDGDREALVSLVVAELHRRELLTTAFVTGAEQNLLIARGLEPRLAICSNLAVSRCVEIGCRILQPANGIATEELVREAHEAGIEVHPFYADDIAEMERLINCGVDGILTNHPERLQKLLLK